MEYLRRFDGIYRTDGVIKYSYDKRGNISKIYKDGRLTHRYFYDSLNRLIREDNGEFKKTYLFAYDCNGNIISKRSMNYTLLASELIEERFGQEIVGGMDSDGMPIYPSATEELAYYDGDKLIQYGEANGAHYFTYDRLGNPNSYNGLECIIEHGGRLKKLGDVTFNYDGLGRRIGKNGVTYGYDTEGRLITQNGNGGTINFIYDGNEIVGIDYNSDIYYFRKDIQGNVVEILGTQYARYEYDAWGNCKIYDEVGNEATYDPNNIGVINPIRYRSYYYDNETNLYYLQTRYYDPAIGRFISSDAVEYLDPETINGLNLYAYCGNNPVMNVDPMGTSFWSWLRDAFTTVTGFLNPFNKIMVAGAIVVAMFQGRWQDLQHDFNSGAFNPFNQDPTIAINSKVFSFYKGEAVIRHSSINLTSWQIGGTIFLNTNVNNPALYSATEQLNVLNHEYGHGVQERFLGLLYLTKIALPSVIACGYDMYIKKIGDEYYSLPWERTADWFGGVNRELTTKNFKYKKYSLLWSFLENILGLITIPFYFMFNH